MNNSRFLTRVVILTELILLLTACSTGTLAPAPSAIKGSPQVPSPTVSPTPRLGVPGCHPPSPLEESNLGPDVRGTGQVMELWILGDKLHRQALSMDRAERP